MEIRGTFERERALSSNLTLEHVNTGYELFDRLASIRPQLDVLDRSHDETAELAEKVFELPQTLQNTWNSADYATKRRILAVV